MQVSSKLLLRTAIIVLGVMLMLGLYLSLSNVNQAQGTTGSDWTKVKGYVDSYITSQYTAADEGEAGFYVNQAQLKARLDSNGDGTILGEGDDAANAPVLVDNLSNRTDMIPGTSYRCLWNNDCFGAGSVGTVKGLVDKHEAAGFSTDIIDYCMTDHTAAPTTGAWGFIAQTGGLATDGSVPKVYGFKWGRNGWTDTVGTYTAANPIGSSAAANTYSNPTGPSDSCNGLTPDSELVRCAANWAIVSTLGNVGNGVTPGGTSPNQTLGATQIVDIRSGSPASTITRSTGYTINVPINTVFNTGMSHINPTATTMVAGRTQGPGGIVAEGMKMLGFNLVSGGFLNSGMPKWNNTMDEKQVATGHVYTLATVTGLVAGSPAAVDTVAPTINSSSATATGPTTADISRTTSEVATTKIDLSGSDGSSVHVKSTILHASNTTSLTGLSPSTTYTGTLTVYDAQANGSSTPISFTTLDTTAPVVTVPANMTAEAISSAGAVVTFTATATDPDDPAGPVSCAPPSGSTFPLGTTTVTCSSTDTHGNTGSASFNVTVVDTTAPAVTVPAPITAEATGPSGAAVTFSASATDTVDGAVAVSCAPPSGSTFPLGTTTVTCSSTDTHGNTGSASFNVTVVDTTAPALAYTGPSGTVSVNNPTVTGTASDSGSGLAANATLSLNGGAATACTVDAAGNISCPTTGLADGGYTAIITISDVAGNTTSASGSFLVSTCVGGKPSLSIRADWAFWASYADYTAGNLTVKYTVANTGASGASNVAITGATATNGVSLVSGTGSLGNIAAGSSVSTNLVYNVPQGVSHFYTSVSGSAQDACGTTYTYP